MTLYSAKYTGEKEIIEKLERIKNAQTKIDRAAVSAGLRVFVRACKSAVPGTIKREIGKSIRVNGGKVSGRAGLVKFPQRGVSKGPHGIYLERGTKYITPRRFIGTALAGAMPTAAAAMKSAIERKIESLVSKD